MVIASAEPGWLHAAGQAAGSILLLELFVALVVILALMVVLAVSAWWVKNKVVPILREYAPKAERVMSTTQQGTDRVVRSVAEFYGRRQQIETGIRVLLFGRGAARQVHENALVQATADLEMMTPAQEGPGPDIAWSPSQRASVREIYSAAGRPSTPAAIEPPAPRSVSASDGSEPVIWRPHQENGHQPATNESDDRYGDTAGSAG
ncbi:MAG TPA: hypothetical protein VKQ30_21765 [Ktedonobacterales bacterium]|nr:hypothetical protein [Ktedonobacterales bacterium]